MAPPSHLLEPPAIPGRFTPFTSDPSDLNSAMLRIQARGRTALNDAIFAALRHLRESSLSKKVLIVVSDGGDNASEHKFSDVSDAVAHSGVIVYTVGLFDEYDKDRNPRVLRQLAKTSGGLAYFPKKVHDTASVLQGVSRDIRNQYTIGYVPKNEVQGGAYHAIRVDVVGPQSKRWIARTRAGYFTGAVDSPLTKDVGSIEP